MIKISVIIPARNRGKTLQKCLNSVLKQTYSPSEIIVVDDGSSDNTKEVVAQYRNKGVVYARLLSGKGAQAARNYGVKIATHDWIAFQDSDDLWLEEKLSVQVASLSERAFAKNIVVHGNGIKRIESTSEETLINVKHTEGYCYAQLLINPAPMFPSILVSKKALFDIGGLDCDCHAYQEWDTAIRLAKYCEFIHIRKPLFVWVWHSGETISKDTRRSVLGYNYVLDKNMQDIIRHCGISAWRKEKMGIVAQAMRAKLWGDVQDMLANQEYHPSVQMARFFLRLRFAPRGIARLLRFAASWG